MERYEFAIEWVCEAGDMLGSVQRDSLDITEKSGHQDIVTRCDREIERFLRDKICRCFPKDQIVGEEYERESAPDADCTAVWYIDPIDGTSNFVNQRQNYAVSVGCMVNGKLQFGVVLDVAAKRLYSAKAGEGAWMNGRRMHTSGTENIREMLLTMPCVTDVFAAGHDKKEGLSRLSLDVRAVRSLGCVALELCEVAAGRADLCVTMKSAPWDHNAGRVILEEAGGSIRDFRGKALSCSHNGAFIAGNSRTAAERIVKEYLR